MDIASLRQGIERLIHTHSSVFAAAIMDSGFSCARCGLCCRENFSIRIMEGLLRPSNAISIFRDDIRRIMKGTGLKWDEIAEPDIYSCLDDGKNIRAIGWLLKRNDGCDCIFYRDRACTIYEWRPMICRVYPFFIGREGIEVMNCRGLGNKTTRGNAEEMARMVKRYEIKKLRSYIGIIKQMGDKLSLPDLRPLQECYSGEVLVCDGETISPRCI